MRVKAGARWRITLRLMLLTAGLLSLLLPVKAPSFAYMQRLQAELEIARRLQGVTEVECSSEPPRLHCCCNHSLKAPPAMKHPFQSPGKPMRWIPGWVPGSL